MDVFVTALICVIIVAICVYAVISYKKKIKSGCCGGDCSCDSQNKKVRKDKSDYAYKTIVYIDGMTCSHCKARVESLLGSDDDCIAGVDLGKKCAHIWSTHPFDEAKIKETIVNNGYKFVRFSLDDEK